MKRFIIWLPVAVVVVVFAWKLVERLSPDAVGMALGVLFGIIAGVPVSLLVIAGNRRQPAPIQEKRAEVFPCPNCGGDLYWQNGAWLRHNCAFEEAFTYDMPPGCYPSGAPQCPKCARYFKESKLGWRHDCNQGGPAYIPFGATPVCSDCGMEFEKTEDGEWYHAHRSHGNRPGKRFVTVPGSDKKQNVVGVVVIQQRAE